MKKSILALTAAAVIAALPVLHAVAATLPQIQHLQNALLGKESPILEQDLNQDGKVNAVDLSLMKRQLETDTGVISAATVPATADYVKLMGRTLRKNDITWLVMSGSAAEFTVTGTSASVTLAGDAGIDAKPDFRPRYAVYVDEELLLDTTLGEKEKTIPLFTGETQRTATVKVILLSEAMYGGLGVKSIQTESSAVTPVKPLPKKNLSIEFIGDSITCAYGVEGTSAYENFKTTTENFTKSYAYLTAKQLDADYSAVSYSGHGIVSGYSSGEKNADSLVPPVYTMTTKQSGYDAPWDFSQQKHDVVVINLGTNDINYVAAEPEEHGAEFAEGYVAFLKTIRENNPDAYIIGTVGTMGGDNVYPWLEKGVEAYQAETGDERVMCYFSATQSGMEGYGSDWHPCAVVQQNSAYVLADKICQALGMESDQIGLDVAADGVYDVAIDTTDGANAAHFVGYDKSFWINMVVGGTAPEQITASVSGIGLQKNGVYRLEFDYNTSVDNTLSFALQGAKTYFSDSVEAVSDRQHYSTEITVSDADENAAIEFYVGGKDYYNVVLANIKLVKIG